MSLGIYQVESLVSKRKRYPQSDVVYFVEPGSIEAVCGDFLPDDEDSVSYDQYDKVHLLLSAPIGNQDYFLEKLHSQPKLVKKL